VSLEHLSAELDALARIDQRRRRVTLESAQGPRIVVDGREYLAFCSNDYLGLANDPRIAASAVDAIRRYGVGSGASHLVTGHSMAHERLENELARFVGMPSALLFSTGYLANIGVVTGLASHEDVIFSDSLNHASLIDGMRLCRAKVVRYPHCSLDALSEGLRQSSRARSRFVVTESVFSMDGDVAPLQKMLELCERHDAWLVVDDAHGFGVLGTEGRGVLEQLGLRSPRIIYVGTLGKAAGVSGAFIAAEIPVVETVLQRARTYIFTTASPPFLAAALETSLQIIQEESSRRQKLTAMIDRLKCGLRDSGLSLSPSDSPIQPIIFGGNTEALAASRYLLDRGVMVIAIRPPTVPEGTSRLRISLSAAHDEADVEILVAALRGLAVHCNSWRHSSLPVRTPA
jgi:8-amino-7-oxononanoate synthase